MLWLHCSISIRTPVCLLRFFFAPENPYKWSENIFEKFEMKNKSLLTDNHCWDAKGNGKQNRFSFARKHPDSFIRSTFQDIPNMYDMEQVPQPFTFWVYASASGIYLKQDAHTTAPAIENDFGSPYFDQVSKREFLENCFISNSSWHSGWWNSIFLTRPVHVTRQRWWKEYWMDAWTDCDRWRNP